MDDYKKLSKEWGSKTRKQQSREKKATFRAAGRQETEPVARVRFIEIHGKKMFLDSAALDDGEVKGVQGGDEPCDGCEASISSDGWLPDCYAGDVVECQGCGTKYFVQEAP